MTPNVMLIIYWQLRAGRQIASVLALWAVAWCFSASRATSDEPPSSPQYARLLSHLGSPNFGKAKENWMRAADRTNLLSPSQQQELWDNYVAFSIFAQRRPLSVDVVGLRIAEPQFQQLAESEWKKIRDDLQSSLARPFTAAQFVEQIVGFERALVRRFQDKDSNVCLFVNLADHHSLARQRDEVWLYIEVECLPARFDIYGSLLVREYSQRRSISPRMYSVPVHPEDEEVPYLAQQVYSQPLIANRPVIRGPGRTLPSPIVDDGLTQAEREDKYHFAVTINQRLDQYQIEQVTFRKRNELSPLAQYERTLSELTNELPDGRVVTYDQLHRILGEFAKKQQAMFASSRENVLISFEIAPYQHGEFTYTRVSYNPIKL